MLRRAALTLGLLLLAPAVAQAAPVDDYDDPAAIGAGGGTTAIISTSAFTVQGGEPTVADGSCPARAKTAWFSITGNGRPITAATDATSFDTVVAVYPTTGPASTPSFGPRAGCDGDGTGNAATVTFASERGRRYLVQVGGKNGAGGSVRMAFTVSRPASDDRASALAIGTGTPVTVDESGATSEAGEVLSCGGSAYAGTVWFKYTATEALDARFSASASLTDTAKPGDVVMAVYRGSDPEALACNDDADAAGGASVALRVTPGDYLVQVGPKGSNTAALGAGTVTLVVGDRDRDRDGALLPGDCNDDDARIHPGAPDTPGDGIDQDCDGADAVDLDKDRDGVPLPADCNDLSAAIKPGAVDVAGNGVDEDCSGSDAVDLDRDRDGFPRPADCNDDRADVNPGRTDIPGNAVDEDCRGGAAKFTALTSGISAFFLSSRTATVVTALSVRSVPAGATLRVTCKGKGCPKARKATRFKAAKSRSQLLGTLARRKLRPGAVLGVSIVRPGFIGVATTWKVRAGKGPLRRDECLKPGTVTTVQTCP